MLTIYQQNHLAPTYHLHHHRLYPAMVEASRAHVVALGEGGSLPPGRVRQLLAGLEELRGNVQKREYDGSFEDTYYSLELDLAEKLGIPAGELDLQLARSRNDLDAGVFRMLLREEASRMLERAMQAVDSLLAAAARTKATIVVAFTHRRPAQPISMGHILAGYADELLGQVRALDAALHELNVSPLGASVIAGTDVPLSATRLAALLGFEDVIPNAYSAVAGADHFLSLSSVVTRILATAARVARVMQEWMSWRWIVTPEEFCQGSSAMPQKRNPVVLEHMQSMAMAGVADGNAVAGSIASSWWEDSNTATTDIQSRLWEMNDRAARFLAMLGRLFEVLEPLEPPTAQEVVAQGTTTTAAAEALAVRGVPFRSAHGLLGKLAREYGPDSWEKDVIVQLAEREGVTLSEEDVQALLKSLQEPGSVLQRAQPEGPGLEAMEHQLAGYRASLVAARRAHESYLEQQRQAAEALDEAVATVLG